jgi:hypothetical protein
VASAEQPKVGSEGKRWSDPDCICGGTGVTVTADRPLEPHPCPDCCAPASEVERLEERLRAIHDITRPGYPKGNADLIVAEAHRFSVHPDEGSS